jgi:HNH endonuclease
MPDGSCSVELCEGPIEGRRLCRKHLRRWKQYGSTELPPKPSPAERLWARVEKSPGPCWVWTGALTGGYGSIRVDGRATYTHRMAYELLVGPVPEGLHLDHLCRNRRCVRPDHLEAVTCHVNVMRGIGPTAVNKRKKVCKRGHALTPDNVRVNARGYRNCLTCYHLRERANRSRRQSLSWIGPLHGPRKPGKYSTVCRNGHVRTAANTEYLRSGGIQCLTCRGRPGGGTPWAERTHCPQGHPYAGDNLVMTTRGSRRCRACHAAYAQKARDRRRTQLAG